MLPCEMSGGDGCRYRGDPRQIKRAVDDGRPDLKHQMSASWRPAHLLLRPQPAMQQPLHGALRWRSGERLVVLSRRRVIDDQVGEAGHVGLQRDQCLRQLRRRSGRRGFSFCLTEVPRRKTRKADNDQLAHSNAAMIRRLSLRT
jgi:hypothetical protein